MSDENRSPVHAYQSRKVVNLLGGPPWGFRIHGGRDTHLPLKVARVNPGSKAAKCGIRDGDLISNINGQSTEELTNVEVQKLIKKSGDRVTLELKGATKRMGPLEGSSSLSPGLSANDQAPATSLSTSQLSSSGAPAVPLSTDESNVTPIVSTASPTAATSATPTKSEKKEKKKSEKSKKKSSQSPSKGEETKDKSRKSGKHQQQQQATPPQTTQQQQPDSVDKATSPPEHAGDAIGDGGGGGAKVDAGKTKHLPQSILKNGASLETNGKQRQRASSSTKKGNGMITGVSSSLLGDIIAELDDLLDADFFNVATNSDNFNANEENNCVAKSRKESDGLKWLPH
ncbi:unnamed protein product [Orchesella dallaii]|uniref:PDZ domain-containing protein n=1 Tax=Orchesella dallaii TaxID=48710 RepID=A0ABP1RDH3_9HEXA